MLTPTTAHEDGIHSINSIKMTFSQIVHVNLVFLVFFYLRCGGDRSLYRVEEIPSDAITGVLFSASFQVARTASANSSWNAHFVESIPNLIMKFPSKE